MLVGYDAVMSGHRIISVFHYCNLQKTAYQFQTGGYFHGIYTNGCQHGGAQETIGRERENAQAEREQLWQPGAVNLVAVRIKQTQQQHPANARIIYL